MMVAGGGKGVVLNCTSPVMVQWPDGTMVILHEDKTVILYDPVKAELDSQTGALRRLLETEHG